MNSAPCGEAGPAISWCLSVTFSRRSVPQQDVVICPTHDIKSAGKCNNIQRGLTPCLLAPSKGGGRVKYEMR